MFYTSLLLLLTVTYVHSQTVLTQSEGSVTVAPGADKLSIGHTAPTSAPTMFSTSLLLLLAAASCVHCEELTQPASMVVRPDQTLTLDCKVSYSVTSYDTDWIRQPAGKALEWIGEITSNIISAEIRLDQSPAEVKKPGEAVKISCTISGYSMTSYNMGWIRQKPGNALEWIGWMSTGSNSATYADSMRDHFVMTEDVSTSVHCEELTQPGSIVVRLDQSLTIDCKVSYSVTSQHTGWIRQPAGKALEWIGIIWNGVHSQVVLTQSEGSGQHLQHTAMLYTFLLLLTTAAPCVKCDIGLIQPSSVVRKPGESLTISCTVSGYSVTDNSYATGWVRQPAGKTLEWIVYMYGGGSIYQTDYLKSKFSISKDASSSTVTLQGQSMQPEDTAVYYWCWSQTLTQSEAVVITPGGSHTLTCTSSGLDFDSKWMVWVRQAAGKGVEWVSMIRGDSGEQYYSPSVQGRFTISRDNSKDQLYLHMSSVKNEDTAVYYCGLANHTDTRVYSTVHKPLQRVRGKEIVMILLPEGSGDKKVSVLGGVGSFMMQVALFLHLEV
ncbi:hypothetical protein NFI96_009737 [Prochilodus magdalenae]|nr:hypothetical protein NFI96_009737 [Prochilodus magdalenae]